MYMAQLNLNPTPSFERALARLMRVRGIRSKAELNVGWFRSGTGSATGQAHVAVDRGRGCERQGMMDGVEWGVG